MRDRDRLLVGGRIRNPGSPVVTSCLGISGGRIVGLGDEVQVRANLRSDPEVVPLGGATVLPGFVEAHAHLRAYSLARRRLDLSRSTSPEDAAEAVARVAATRPPGAWIQGRGWNKNRWPGQTFPDRRVLDHAAPGHPVALWSHDGHILWLNRRALEALGYWGEVPRGDGGEFVVDPATGEPTGIATERMADLARERLPEPGPDEVERAAREGLASLAALGIVALHNFEGIERLPLWSGLEASGELSLRLLLHFAADELDEALSLGLVTGFGSDRLRLGAVKVYLDGALTGQTAHLLDPYEPPGAGRGVEVTRAGDFDDVVARAQAGGISVSVHAIGDAANRVALDAYERHPSPPRIPLAPRIEHAQILHPADVPRFGRLGVVASVQPCHLFEDMPTADRYLGERAGRSEPLASLLETGARLAFGSDAPIEHPDPRRGLYAAIARRRPDGWPGEGGWHPRERLGIEAALEAYTLGGAIAGGTGHRQGRIEVGRDADLVVLGEDPARVDPESILDISVLRTIVGGDDTYVRET